MPRRTRCEPLNRSRSTYPSLLSFQGARSDSSNPSRWRRRPVRRGSRTDDVEFDEHALYLETVKCLQEEIRALDCLELTNKQDSGKPVVTRRWPRGKGTGGHPMRDHGDAFGVETLQLRRRSLEGLAWGDHRTPGLRHGAV